MESRGLPDCVAVFGAVLALVLTADPTACSGELFRIERSKNANVVVYEVHAKDDASLDPDQPVTATWLLLASTGAREKLGFFERMMAYGFDVKLDDKHASATLRLKALKDRVVRVIHRGACLVAVGLIDGAEAVLQRVFVTTDERGAVPKVTSVELFGVDVATGEARMEKLRP